MSFFWYGSFLEIKNSGEWFICFRKEMEGILGDIIQSIVRVFLVGVLCMEMGELTLGEEEGRKERLIKWGAGIVIYIIAMLFLDQGMEMLIAFFDNEFLGKFGDSEFGYVIYMGVYVLVNFVRMIRPIFLALPMFIWLYRQERAIKVFLAVLTVLMNQIVTYYFELLFSIPFLDGEIEETASRYITSIPIDLAINISVNILFFLIYWRIFSRKMRKFLDASEGHMKNFVILPIISSIFCAILISTLNSYGIDCYSIYWQDAMIYVVILGCLIFTYLLMYWCIFAGLRLSADITKEEAELNVAKNIQTSILPCTFPAYPNREEFELYATMEAAKEIGGDFYDFFLVDETHLAIVIADVSGKGIPASLFMMTARTLLKNLVKTGKELGQVMMEANTRLCENNEMEMFVTVFLGVLETDTGRFVYANAGHNPPYLYRKGESYEALKIRPGFVLGGMEGIRYRQQEIVLQDGDALFLYTDGVTEALNPEEELYSEKRLHDLLNLEKLKGKTVEEILHAVREDIDIFADGAQQADDITMLMIRFTPVGRRENVG